MDERREQLIQILTSTQLVNTNVYNILKQQNPLLAKLMLDKFKALLVNSDISDIERQTLLIGFLESQKDYSVIKDILEHIHNCELKDDYNAIIMEWTYHNTDTIIRNNLKTVDGVGLCETRQEPDSSNINLEIPQEDQLALQQFLTEMVNFNSNEEDPDEGDGGIT